MRRQHVAVLAFDDGQQLHVLAFHRETHSHAAHQQEHDLGKIVELARRDEGTVVRGHAIVARCLARRPHQPHRGHDLLREYRLANLGILGGIQLIADFLVHEIEVTIHGFDPGFAPAFVLDPARISAVIHELGEWIAEIFFRFGRALLHMLGHILDLVPDLGPLVPIQNVGLGGLGEIEQDQRFFDQILNFLHLRHMPAG